jgi:hypothetical protein
MQLVKKDIQELSINTFPYINSPILFGEEDKHKNLIEENYDIQFISAFDHWLTVDEYDTSTVCFAEFQENKNESYLEYEEKFIEFYKSLYSIGAYAWEESNDFSRLSFLSFDNEKEYIEKCLESLREIKTMSICVPEIHIIICGGFDLTQKVLINKKTESSRLVNLVNDNNLYLLS